ncbi:LAME_0G00584g1_1 [Lachancea meyersii CBS 8951]|uniref:LAME_0G00584g1_1 n=1 Tax=Lachancea meyersii CBS 8951 TaxID=1266667 RepID=A0A1G4K4U9_9SACH|nr:LAME_0G00584g1_1 [Lachancea meyersii CBS 8951]
MSQGIVWTPPSSSTTHPTAAATSTIAVDIGGSLAKLVFFAMDSKQLVFETVETEKIAQFMLMIHEIINDYNNGQQSNVRIVATGGGAYKFHDLLCREFPDVLEITRLDEMECLIKGLDYFIHEVPEEVFTYNDLEGEHKVVPEHAKVYPYMLVNIGSGVSILKVDSPAQFTRVGGSSLGGGTLWGLLSLITGAKTYDEMLSWAHGGDNTHVDMLVGDIYGSNYGKIGLKSTHIASSFGKVFQRAATTTTQIDSVPHSNDSETSTDNIQLRNRKFNNSDISKSLLYAISNNIGQIAYLQAKIHNVPNIYFGGSYIRGHLMTMNTLSYAINFWSGGEKQAFFLRHEGYLGAMGAFLTFQSTNNKHNDEERK